MVVIHAKKHDINSDKDHIKNDLDLNGNFSIPFDKQILLGIGSPYAVNSYLKWDEAYRRMKFGRSLEIEGSLYLVGESSIYGGVLDNDSITIHGSRTKPFPQIYIEGNTSTGYVIEEGSNQYFEIIEAGLTPTNLFRIDKDYMRLYLPIETSTLIENSLAIIPDAGFYWDYPDGLVYSVFDSSDNTLYFVNSKKDGSIYLSADYNYINGIENGITGITHIGDGFGGINDTNFDLDGHQTMVGNARVWKSINKDGYNVYGYSGTYNGITTNATSLSVVGSQYLTQVFTNTGGFNPQPKSFITTFVIPEDYEQNSDLKIILNWSSDSTGGAINFGVGIAPIKTGDVYNTPNYTYVDNNYSEGTVSNYEKIQTEITFTSVSLNKGDELGVVVYNNFNDAGNTSTGIPYVSSIVLKYVSDKLGEKVV